MSDAIMNVNNTDAGRKAALAAGFIALAISVLLGNAQQPTEYELSIYAGTPTGFWIGLGIALAISLLVSLTVERGWIRTTALVLGGMSISAIAALPVLRGYYFYGTADAMTHLGWTRDMANGVLSPSDLFYPGIHSFSVIFSTLTGIQITRSILFVVATMTVLTLVFVPLAVRVIARDDHAIAVAAFSTFLLFMIHNLGVYLHAHSFSQTTFFSALVIFLVFAYLVRGPNIALAAMLAIGSFAAILYHPQQAANLIIIFGAISILQFLYRRYKPEHPIADHQTLYVHTGVFVVAFALWISRFEGWAFYNLSRVEQEFFAYIAGTPPVAGGSLQSQTTSLVAVGSGLPEIFVKLFLVAFIFTVLAGVLMAASLLGIADDYHRDENAIAIYFAVGSFAILPVIVAYFAGNIAEHYFRHIGFLLLVATIVGSLSLSRGVTILSSRRGQRFAIATVAVAFAILLPLSLATAYPSPYMYKQSQHVTEPQMDGYQTVFDIEDESLRLAGIRQGPWRYSEAIEGVTEHTYYETVVSNDNMTRLPASFEDGGYVVVTDYDRQREVRAYRELRYTDGAFRSLDAQPGVNQVGSNGQLKLYHVPEGAE